MSSSTGPRSSCANTELALPEQPDDVRPANGRHAGRLRQRGERHHPPQAPATAGLIRGRDLKSGLSAALAAAEADGLAEAGTEHLLLGLLTDGVAAATLEQLGVTREENRDASAYPASTTPSQHAVLSAEGQAALAAAEQLATERIPTCAPVVVNTPQLLAVIALKPGSRARRVLNDIGINTAGINTAGIKRQLHCYINVPRTSFGHRTRRKHRLDDSTARCSFCGHPRSDEHRLVAGPDIWICSDCHPLRRNPRPTPGRRSRTLNRIRPAS
ncbi:Clp protease N-terminal domain-containing protein [Streptomyces sp. NPDC055400]